MAQRKSIVKWLLAGDPAIAWQALRDLPAGAGRRGGGGAVAGGHRGLGRRFARAPGPGRPLGAAGRRRLDDHGRRFGFTAAFGLDPAGEPARLALGRVREQIRWWQLAERALLRGRDRGLHQRADPGGGFLFRRGLRCFGGAAPFRAARRRRLELRRSPSRRSSFHSTLCVLEGLLEYERRRGASPALTEAQRRGREYLTGAPAPALAVDRRAARPQVDAVFVPAGLALRRLAGARLFSERRSRPGPARWPRPWGWWRSGGTRTGAGR